jgi:hypothetical protein
MAPHTNNHSFRPALDALEDRLVPSSVMPAVRLDPLAGAHAAALSHSVVRADAVPVGHKVAHTGHGKGSRHAPDLRRDPPASGLKWPKSLFGTVTETVLVNSYTDPDCTGLAVNDTGPCGWTTTEYIEAKFALGFTKDRTFGPVAYYTSDARSQVSGGGTFEEYKWFDIADRFGGGVGTYQYGGEIHGGPIDLPGRIKLELDSNQNQFGVGKQPTKKHPGSSSIHLSWPSDPNGYGWIRVDGGYAEWVNGVKVPQLDPAYIGTGMVVPYIMDVPRGWQLSQPPITSNGFFVWPSKGHKLTLSFNTSTTDTVAYPGGVIHISGTLTGKV